MKAYSVINVIPGRMPVGAMNPDTGLRAVRMRVFRLGNAMARKKSGRTLRRVFGATYIRVAPSLMLLAARLGFAVWLAVLGIGGIMSGGGAALPAALLTASVAVAVGFFTRIMMAAGAVVLGIMCAKGYADGITMLQEGIACLLMLLFSLTGPGRYSCDSIMCCGIFRSVRRRQMHKLLQNRFSYRACEYTGYGI